MTVLEILCGLAVILMALYYYFTATYDFWKSRGVPGPVPTLNLGNFKDIVLGRISPVAYPKYLYDKYPEAPLIGFFLQRQPVLLVTDPDFMKDILIKDFTSFSDRAIHVIEKVEPLSMHLASLETKRWRPLRNKLSPTFTSGKLKQMFYLILECGELLEKCLGDLVEKGEPVDCKEVTARFTTDVIGCCAFGLQMNALESEESEFRKMGRKITEMDFKTRMMFLVRAIAPWLYVLLKQEQDDVTKFFMKTMKETMEHRRKNKEEQVRHDFVDLLMELKDNQEKSDFELTDSLITAQAFVFFGAGFETSSSTMSNALYELAQNHAIQDRLRKEIKEILKKYDGKLQYESIKDMKYLHMIFQETLRKYPIATVLRRRAMNDYTFSGTNVQIPKGQVLWIPVFAIHRDPKYYPEPEVFDPERFTDEACKERNPMTYLPFGDGPRNCIGARFANYQTKVGLIKILANHRVDVCDKTRIPYTIDRKAYLLSPEGGIHLKFHKIN